MNNTNIKLLTNMIEENDIIFIKYKNKKKLICSILSKILKNKVFLITDYNKFSLIAPQKWSICHTLGGRSFDFESIYSSIEGLDKKKLSYISTIVLATNSIFSYEEYKLLFDKIKQLDKKLIVIQSNSKFEGIKFLTEELIL